MFIGDLNLSIICDSVLRICDLLFIMFVSLITFIIYAASYSWIVIFPQAWLAGAVVGFAATALFGFWYVPKRFLQLVPYLLVTEVFVVGSWVFLLMVDRAILVWIVVALSVCLAVWWKYIFFYYHEKERYRVLAIPKAAQWFLPAGSFVFLSGLWGLEIFYGASKFLLLGLAALGWFVLTWGATWFAKLEFRGMRATFWLVFACFLELSYVLYFMPLTIFVKGALGTLFLIIASRVLRLDVSQEKLVRRFVKEAAGVMIITLIILFTARWQS